MAKEPQNHKKEPKSQSIKSLSGLGEALGHKPTETSRQAAGKTDARVPSQSGSSSDVRGSQVPSGRGSGGQPASLISIPIPLRQEVANQVQARWKQCHPGLAYAKFPNTWKKSDEKNTSFRVEGPQKRDFFQRLRDLMSAHEKSDGAKLFEQFLTRRCRMFETLRQAGWQVASIPLATDWRLISGLGIAHPFETGFVFDRTYGVPYLPGSSVKGAARAWAEETGWTYPECELLFGPDQHPPRGQNGIKPFVASRGHVVFFDAYPVTWPALELDILNPHYKKYYESKTGTTPPADWLSPEPTYFLTVKAGTKWEFVVGVPSLDRSSEATVCQMVSVLECADPGEEAIQQALERKAKEAVQGAATELGLGGKTAVGYGYFRP